MNILLISHFFPPHKGGVETASYNTAKILSKLGHNVVVLTSKTKLEKRKLHKMDGFLVYRFRAFNPPEFKLMPQISSFGFIPLSIFKLLKIIKKHKIHLIHAQGRFFPISFISTILNKLTFRLPMVITVQGRLKIGVTGLFENIFDFLITRCVYQRAKKIICVSNSLRKRLLNFKIQNDKLIVIPNGVDTSTFKRNDSSKFLDKYLVKKKDYKKVIFVGRLDAQKGVQYLLRAIPNVLKQYKKVHFFILGNGNLENDLKKLAKRLKIQSNVTFLDMIPLEKMPEFYSSADIFCLPSIHEGFPLSIAETLSIGLVIVASATEGVPEAIKENKNGFLVEPKNVSNLTEKLIKSLVLNEEEIKQIQNNNIKLAKSKYSWNIIVKHILAIYKESLTKSAVHS